MEKAGQNDLLFLSKKYRKMDIFANSPYFRLEYNREIRACQRENDVRFVCCRMHRNLNRPEPQQEKESEYPRDS